MAINKVAYVDQTLLDLTEDTVTADKVLEGETFHDKSGILRSGNLVIPVQDVEVNGESVVDPTTKIAEIISYEEVTKAEYDNLPSSKESDNVLYMVYSDGQILDPDYSYHKYGNNDEIIVRVYHEGRSDQQTLWFFRGWNQSSGIMDIPSSLIAYAPSDTSRSVASISFTDNTGATQNGWIGFYSNNIRIWSQDWASYITGIMYGVVDPEGAGYPNPQTNPYVDDPYIYVPDPSARSARRIYLNGREYAEFNIPTTDIQTAVDEFETYNGGLLSECKVALSPNQDLHGYENPWVGGAGKNKLEFPYTDSSKTVSGITYTVKDNGDVAISGTATSVSYFTFNNARQLVGNGQYIFSKGTTDTVILGADRCQISNNAYINRYADNTSSPTTSEITINIEDADNNYARFWISVKNGETVNTIIHPMIRLATESDPTFEPYSNICPISGHTQVEVDVSDGQTTQEQVTVNLGGTYYSGTLDVVSGVFVPDKKGIVVSDIGWSGTNGKFYSTNPISDIKHGDGRYDYAISSGYKTANKSSLSQLADGETSVDASGYLQIKDMQYTTSASFVSDRGSIQIVYELATPTSIQLSPTMVKALVGENHLSAPLDGQEITESEYRELFTWDEVEEIAQKIADSKIDNLNTSYDTTFSSVFTEARYVKKIYGAPVLTALQIVLSGATSITFNHQLIFSDSQTCCELIQFGSGARIGITDVAISQGSVTFTFDSPLTKAIGFRCRITNDFVS